MLSSNLYLKPSDVSGDGQAWQPREYVFTFTN
jgi:hypothetical protein